MELDGQPKDIGYNYMITQHLTFVRKVGKFAILVTVKDLPNESFVHSTTTSNIYTNMMPSIQLSDKVCKHEESETKGNSIDGILTSPLWFVRKIKDQLSGLIS